MTRFLLTAFFGLSANLIFAQKAIPLDTLNWNITGSYITENYKGKDAIYIKQGSLTLKNSTFLNGTIEFDIYLKEIQGFPGVYFRLTENGDGEQFYIRPHLPGKPDANQAAPLVKGISPWQLFFGPSYSFPYEYKYDDWTHVKIVVNEDKAQVFLDHSETPNLSWILTHGQVEGGVVLRGGNNVGLHIADVKIDKQNYQLKDFKPIDREPIPGLVTEWEISDKFEESRLEDFGKLKSLISERKWQGSVRLDEGAAANISKVQMLRNGKPGNTVFAKLEITSDSVTTKLFEFGYSDRAVVILNGKPLYWGNNRWRSRDYRYLGTIGLFDAVYLNLKRGKNTLLIAVSEDFGGWLVTGRIKDKRSLKF